MRLGRAGAAALAAAALALGGCGAGNGDAGSGDLVWQSQPRLIRLASLPNDRILTGKVRNDSLRRLDLAAKDLKLEASGGERVQASVIFLQSFVHGLYPPTRAPKELPLSETQRTGLTIRLDPGKTAPLTVAWREGGDRPKPVRIAYGTGALPIR